MKRRMAREIAVQSLYQMEMNKVSSQTAITAALEDLVDTEEKLPAPNGEELGFIGSLVNGTFEHKERIDALLVDYLKGWRMDRLSRVDRQILRLAVFEMFFGDDTPQRVAVNEAIELAKHFGTEESGKFVNGVLGQMIKDDEAIRGKLAGSQPQS